MQANASSLECFMYIHVDMYILDVCILEITEEDDETVAMIKELLDTRIR